MWEECARKGETTSRTPERCHGHCCIGIPSVSVFLVVGAVFRPLFFFVQDDTELTRSVRMKADFENTQVR